MNAAGSSTAARRLLPWLLVLPALAFATPLSPIVGDPYPHLAGAGWAALALVPLALLVLARGASLAGAWPFLAVLAWALLARALAPVSDTLEARRMLLVLALAPLAFAGGTALDAPGRARFQDLLVLLSLAWSGFALWSGASDDDFAGVLGDTGSLSQAALPGAAVGALALVRARGARRVLGGLALAGFLAHVAAAPVLAGSHTLLAGLLLGAWLVRGPGRAALAALALTALLAPFVGMAVRELTSGTPVHVEGALATPSHSLGGLGVRGSVWRAALGLVRDHPLVGVGPGQFQAAFPPYRDPREIERSRHGVCSELDTEVEHAHNDWLQAFCELGLPGGLLFALGLGLVTRAALRALRDDTRVGLAVAALALLVNAFVHAPLLANPASATLAFALFGTLADPRGPATRARAAWLALPLLAASAFAGPLIQHGRALVEVLASLRALDRLEQEPAGPARELRIRTQGEHLRASLTAALEAAPDSAPARAFAARPAFAPWSASRADPSTGWDALLDVRPHAVEAWEQSATDAARAGRYAEAHRRYARALELSPTHPRILRNAARLECTQGDLELGLALVERLRSEGCSTPGWSEALGAELVLELGAPARGAQLLSGRELSALVPEELHARARNGAEQAEACECLAQLLWARAHAASGSFELAVRNYRQAAERSWARRGTEAGPAALYAFELAAAELRAGRSADATARVAGLELDAVAEAELPDWARVALGELARPAAPR